MICGVSFYIVILLARINARIQALIRQGFGIPSEITVGTVFGTKKKITKKITQSGDVGNQHLPLALSTFLWQNSQIFGTKPLPCRRFLHHYYRGANVETQKPQKAHRSPTDVLSWSPNLQHAYSPKMKK